MLDYDGIGKAVAVWLIISGIFIGAAIISASIGLAYFISAMVN